MRAGWLVLVAMAGCSGPSGPSLELLDKEVNLGRIKTEEVHKAKFRIRNNGSETLQIRSVDVGCGCTRPSYPKTVPPGAEAAIEVEFTPDLLWSGPRSDAVTILTNDAKQGKIVAKMVSDLNPPLRFDSKTPKIVSFTPGEPQIMVVKATSRSGGKPPLLSAKSSDPRVIVQLGSQGANSVLHLSFGTKKVAGDIDSRLILRTGVSAAPLAEFHLRGEAKDAPFVAPAVVQVRQLRADAVGSRLATLSLYGRGGAPNLVSASSFDKALELKVEKDEKRARTWVSVIYRGGWKPGSRQSAVQLVTDHPKYPILEAPVVANVVAK